MLARIDGSDRVIWVSEAQIELGQSFIHSISCMTQDESRDFVKAKCSCGYMQAMQPWKHTMGCVFRKETFGENKEVWRNNP